jgi:hypothetical protein
LPLPPSQFQIFSSAPRSQTSTIYVLPWARETEFHTHTKQQIKLYLTIFYPCRSQWPSSLRQVLSSAARTLGLQVRILLGAWMYVCVFLCCVVLCR